MKKIQITTLIVTTTNAACVDPIIGDWALSDYDDECTTTQSSYDYNGTTITYDIESCMTDLRLEFSVDDDLKGEVSKFKSTLDQMILYAGQEFGPYSTDIDASGSAAVTKKENNYKITFSMQGDVTSGGNTSETDFELVANCTLSTELTCVDDDDFSIKFTKQ